MNRIPLSLLAWCCMLSLTEPVTVQAQELSLQVIDSLAASGDVGQARAALDEWWRERGDSASRNDVQLAIWLRGRLSLDAARAEREYQRLVVEFPGGRYTDGALLRLALAAQSRGDVPRAATYLETLLRDYPSSSHRADASRRLADFRANGSLATAQATSAAAAAARTAPSPGTRPASGGLPPAAERPPPAAERTPAPAAGETGRYSVQLGAFSSETRARNLATASRRGGFESRVVRVPGSRLIRVRVGRFSTQEAAAAVRARAVAGGFAAAVVNDATVEQPVP
ncbi:MAG: SPOR domain-containing protein [Gemmatimonadetes bacterium]|nr:SPOR domain-containing protein [Gemmatimonadota bacterium]